MRTRTNARPLGRLLWVLWGICVWGLPVGAMGQPDLRSGSTPTTAAATREPLVVYPPMGLPGLHEVVDGKAVGLYPELIERLSRAAGLPMQVRSAPWPEPLEAVRQGRGDVLGPLLSQSSELSDLVFSAPIMRIEWARYVRSGESRLRSGIAYQGVRIAVVADSVGTRWLKREHPSVVQVGVKTLQEGLEALIDGRADAFLGLKLPTRRLVGQYAVGTFEEVGTELTAPMFMAFAPKSAKQIGQLNAAIDALAAQGEFERLLDRWLPPVPMTAAEQAQERLNGLLMAMTVLLLLLSIGLWGVNRRLRRATRLAEEARQAKSDFLAVMSHEIRTPINGLVNLIDLLQRGPNNPEQSALLLQAERANRSLLTLVNQVLDYSKIEALRMEIRPHAMKLDELAQQVEAVLAAQTRHEGVRLSVTVDAPEVPELWADAQRLSQVLINLGGNALKFTTRGHVSVSVRSVTPPRDEAGRWRLRFEVEDTGQGIPAEEMHRLFQPFVQLKAGLDRPHSGTGLGLSTSRELVRQMGSELQVVSTPGQRTRFWFDVTFPAAPQELAAKEVAAECAFQAWTVMVVDDNPLNLLVTQKILQQEGHRVVQANGAASALAHLQAHPDEYPDVILMDLHMPEVDGLQAMQQIKALLAERTPPVVAVSGAVTDDVQHAAREMGMVAFLPKPFDRVSLMTTLKSTLRSTLKSAPQAKP